MSAVSVLMAMARRLNAEAGSPALPPLFCITDPARTPDPVALAERLPAGAGLIYRHFGAEGRRVIARRLAALCRRRGIVFLIGADAELARAVGADGVHLPERMVRRGLIGLPGRLTTGAAHSAAAVRRAEAAGLDAVLLSPVFPSQSASAGAPLGIAAVRRIVRRTGLPVYALGGVTMETARRLRGSGVAGLAAVGALL